MKNILYTILLATILCVSGYSQNTVKVTLLSQDYDTAIGISSPKFFFDGTPNRKGTLGQTYVAVISPPMTNTNVGTYPNGIDQTADNFYISPSSGACTNSKLKILKIDNVYEGFTPVQKVYFYLPGVYSPEFNSDNCVNAQSWTSINFVFYSTVPAWNRQTPLVKSIPLSTAAFPSEFLGYSSSPSGPTVSTGYHYNLANGAMTPLKDCSYNGVLCPRAVTINGTRYHNLIILYISGMKAPGAYNQWSYYAAFGGDLAGNALPKQGFASVGYNYQQANFWLTDDILPGITYAGIWRTNIPVLTTSNWQSGGWRVTADQ